VAAFLSAVCQLKLGRLKSMKENIEEYRRRQIIKKYRINQKITEAESTRLN
jgi:hypothetical protein